MDYQLLVLKGRSVVNTIRLPEATATIGRQDGCEVTVRSSQVSRKHCQLFEKKGLLLVKDLGSANGTLVNGKRVEEQRVLEPGDVLTVGPIQFRVEKLGAEVAAPAGPADISTGSDVKRKPSDTAVAEPVETPIPLDEDDVLEFVLGDDEPAAPAKKPTKPSPAAAPKAATAAAPKAAPAPVAEPAPAAKAAAPKPKPEPEPPPTADEGGADEAIAEFLMGIEIDDEDRR